MAEPGVKPSANDQACPARSPEQHWWCCLPAHHDGNHIGTTADFGSLYQWPQDEATDGS